MSGPGCLCKLEPCLEVKSEGYDGVIIVTDSTEKLTGDLQCLAATLEDYKKIDAAFEKELTVHRCDLVPSGRVIFSPTGPLNRDYDDVRRFQDAAIKAIKRAISAGMKSPLFVRPIDDSFPLAGRVATLGALHAAYVPLEIREAGAAKAKKVDKMGIWCNDADRVKKGIDVLQALETGRIVARDIGGSDPERMAAPRVADYVQDVFKGTCISVNVISDPGVFDSDYPLLSAVNRAASSVPRHHGRLIFLEYCPEGPIDTTLLLVGKGITYDTGGADIKAGGVMAGMHRDKCGAAAVAGFFQTLAAYKPKGLKVLGGLAMVRNSVGEECYVADEIITSRAGVRVRVGNTDAEGRMVMTDVLCHMKEKALKEANPHIFTVATLTGHVIRAYGDQYAAVCENGPARQAKIGEKLQTAGDQSGDPFEISTIRREDYVFHTGKSEYEDVLQCNNAPSTMTARGHQSPAAFMIMSSGLDKHGIDSKQPLKYCHLDVAGASGPFPGVPTGSPLVALAHAFVLNRETC